MDGGDLRSGRSGGQRSAVAFVGQGLGYAKDDLKRGEDKITGLAPLATA